MAIFFQIQWAMLLLACVAHAMPRPRGRGAGRGRGKKAHGVHAHPPDGHAEVECDMLPSFEAWAGRFNKKWSRRPCGHEERPPSVMARYLLESWGFGLKSAWVVQKEAAMAVADGADHKDLLMLAELGGAVHDSDVGPIMWVAHICSYTSMFAHDVPCNQWRD